MVILASVLIVAAYAFTSHERAVDEAILFFPCLIRIDEVWRTK